MVRAFVFDPGCWPKLLERPRPVRLRRFRGLCSRWGRRRARPAVALLSWQRSLWTTIGLAGDSDGDRAVRAILARLARGAREEGALARGLAVAAVQLAGCSGITDRSLAIIARNTGRTLRQLEVSGCRNVTNGGILDLVTRCEGLTHLDVSGGWRVFIFTPVGI